MSLAYGFSGGPLTVGDRTFVFDLSGVYFVALGIILPSFVFDLSGVYFVALGIIFLFSIYRACIS